MRIVFYNKANSKQYKYNLKEHYQPLTGKLLYLSLTSTQLMQVQEGLEGLPDYGADVVGNIYVPYKNNFKKFRRCFY